MGQSSSCAEFQSSYSMSETCAETIAGIHDTRIPLRRHTGCRLLARFYSPTVKQRPSSGIGHPIHPRPHLGRTQSLADRALISDGRAQLDQLETAPIPVDRRRDDLAEHILRHRAILSLVRRVHPELIFDILASTVSNRVVEEDADSTRWISENDKFPSPWHLSQVCRAWRQCALACPLLWSFIFIPSSLPSTGGHSLLSKIENQLIRSSNAPLDIYWRSVQSKVDTRLLDLVLPHCNRWRILSFQGAPFIRLPIVLDWLQPINGNLRGLETVKVGKGLQFPDVFSWTVNLRRAILTNSHFSTRAWRIIIPWGQITHYRASYAPERQLEILTSAPNLVDCGIGFSYPFTTLDLYAHPIVVLPHFVDSRSKDLAFSNISQHRCSKIYPSYSPQRTPSLPPPIRPPIFLHHQKPRFIQLHDLRRTHNRPTRSSQPHPSHDRWCGG
ncbi:hypothetical protein B0H19DRAFT_1184525 [Mycena capillaripes]|nr:hypothetical protein B0H19DRAFT_1184525 [Mycena capillaripes]